MRALIMAGGAGSRLNLGEKPLITLCGRPMIEYITDAFTAAGFEPVVAASMKTPMTVNWCRARGIAICKAEGKGYVEDMVESVLGLEEQRTTFYLCFGYPLYNSGYHPVPSSRPISQPVKTPCQPGSLQNW